MEYSKKTWLYFFFNLLIALLFVFIIFINSIGYNLLTFNTKWSFEFQFLFPQGWAFFTKDPRGEQTIVYKIEPKKLIECDFKNGGLNSFFGISRTNRVMLIELAQITNQLDSSKWKNLNSKEDLKIYVDTAKSITIINFVNKARMTGEYLILKQRQVPWSWRKNSKNLYMPSTGIKIHLEKF